MTTKLSVNNLDSQTLQWISGPRITSIQVADSQYNILDDTAVDINGGYIVINGNDFGVNPQVLIDNTPALSVSRVSDTLIRAQVPSSAVGTTYTVIVVNTDGSSAVLVNGLTYSAFPAWVTGSSLYNQYSYVPLNIQVSANEASNSSITYSLAASNTLPSSLTLYSNGYVQGRVTANANATYNFTVNAKDSQNQDTNRAFSLPITAYSAPVWLPSQLDTLTNIQPVTFYGNTVVATSIAILTYTITSGSLPPGLQLDSGTGLISGFSSVPGLYNFTITATDNVGFSASKSFNVTVISSIFNHTSLLLKTSGVNNSNNSVFIDRSSNNQIFVNTGSSVTQGSFSPYAPTGWSFYSDGTSTAWPTGMSTAFVGWGGRTRSVDFWVYRSTENSGCISKDYDAVASNGRWYIEIAADGTPSFGWTTATDQETSVASNVKVPANTWTYVSYTMDCRNSSTSTIYIGVNGIVETFTNRNLSTQGTTQGNFSFFTSRIYGAGAFVGYIADFRWSSNLRYTANYSVPTSSIASDANAFLLMAKIDKPAFRDYGANVFSLNIASSGQRQVPFSPFLPATSYTSNSHAGSGYFLPSTYISNTKMSGNVVLGLADFCYETWVYPESFNYGTYGAAITAIGTASQVILLRGGKTSGLTTSGNYYAGTSGNFIPAAGFDSGISAGTLRANTWNHLALSKQGPAWKFYVNEIMVNQQIVNQNAANSYALNFDTLRIGADNTPGDGQTFGHIGLTRLVVGNAVYSGNVINATATLPKTAGNTIFLVDFTNASIYDAAGKNDFESIGVTVNTSISKFGGGSLYFNGSTGYIRARNNRLFNFRTLDFTIEWWMYCAIDWTSMTNPGVMGQKTGDSSQGWQIYRNSSTNPTELTLRIAGTNDYSSGSTPITGVWEHWAITRASGTLRFFKSGNLTNTHNSVTGDIIENIGMFYMGQSQTWGGYFNGYIEEPRIITGRALYTGAFVPQTSPYATI